MENEKGNDKQRNGRCRVVTLNVEEIMKVLPHRYPMLLIDRIIECDDKAHIVGIKNVSVNDPILVGHFPGAPIMPGVLQLEAMAQTAGVLLNRLIKMNKMDDLADKIPYFLGVDSARFRKVVRPGDQMRIEVKFTKHRGPLAKFKGTITVDGVIASEAEMMCMITDEKASSI